VFFNNNMKVDFVVRHNFKKETDADLVRKIFKSLFLHRIKNDKPVILFIEGKSGEGKSLTAIKILIEFFKLQGLIKDDLEYLKYLDATNVFHPLEYADKLYNLINNKELKKINGLIIHEARDIMNAKDYKTAINRLIADINAQLRAVKKMLVIIISQSIKDIDRDERRTLTYYVEVWRPLFRKVRMKLSLFWEDKRDLENIKLRKRAIRGYIVDENGKYRLTYLKHLKVSIVPKEIKKAFQKQDYEKKFKIIRFKTTKLLRYLKKKYGEDIEAIDKFADYLYKHKEILKTVGKRYRGKWILTTEAMKMFGLTKDEIKEIQEKLNEKFSQEVYGGVYELDNEENNKDKEEEVIENEE